MGHGRGCVGLQFGKDGQDLRNGRAIEAVQRHRAEVQALGGDSFRKTNSWSSKLM